MISAGSVCYRVAHLLPGTKKTSKSRLRVSARDPAVAGPELKLRELRIASDRVKGGEQSRGINAIANGGVGHRCVGHVVASPWRTSGSRWTRFAAWSTRMELATQNRQARLQERGSADWDTCARFAWSTPSRSFRMRGTSCVKGET